MADGTNIRLLGGAGLLALGTAMIWSHFAGDPSAAGLFAFASKRVITLDTDHRPIDQSDVLRVTRQLDHWATRDPGRPVALVLNTGGGYLGPSIQITHAVRRHGNVWACVPYYALSGGTLIALGAKRIVMTPVAHLGPVDPQICGFSASSLINVVKAKTADTIDDHTYALASEAEKAVKAMTQLVRDLAPAVAVERLVAGHLPHSFPLTREEARSLGLRVEAVDNTAHLHAVVEQLALPQANDS